MDRKKKKAKLEKTAAKIFEEQNKLALMEKELQQNEQFKNYLKLQQKVKNQDVLFRETIKNEMLEFDIPKIEGDWGSITLVRKETIKVLDVDKVPAEYKSERVVIDVDTKAIKEDYTFTDVLPAGVELNKSEYVLIKVKGDK